MIRKVRIGTRGSQLALWQAHHIENLLKEQGLDTEIVIINTKGDKILNKSISKIGSKGVFTEDLEHQLRNKDIDIAVHSAKDMQSNLDDDFKIIALTEREKPNDVIISFNKDFSLEQQHDLIVGTSSTRRVALLRNHYPHMRTASIRGNLQTRMKRLEEGMCDAIILAYAGVHRMGYDENIVKELSLDIFTPPAGQGSILVECHQSIDAELEALIHKVINHPPTEYCVTVERAFLKELEGGCSVPVFIHARLEDDTLLVQGGVADLNGKQVVRKERKVKIDGFDLEFAQKLGIEIAQEVADAGGKDLLDKIKAEKDDV